MLNEKLCNFVFKINIEIIKSPYFALEDFVFVLNKEILFLDKHAQVFHIFSFDVLVKILSL